MLLALDTCFNGCSAALYDEVQMRVVASRFEAIERGHAEALGPMVETIFEEAGLGPTTLSRIAVTRGPGTFTGLRIGLAYAKGMALALDLPLIGIDSLVATAAPHFGKPDHIVVVQQAGGTGQYYWARFDGETGACIVVPTLARMEDIAASTGTEHLSVVGSGATAFSAIRPQATVLGPAEPDAKLFAPWAAQLSPSIYVEPLYLRAPDAKPSASAGAATSRVRQATHDDLAIMADIHAQCFPKGWTAEDLAATLSVPGAGAMVVELAGTVYGFVQFQWVAGEVEINTVCVSPNYRRQHFGSDLMRGLVAELQSRATTKLFLEVADDNAAARALYQHFGFQQTGLRKSYYSNGRDAVTMTRDLAA